MFDFAAPRRSYCVPSAFKFIFLLLLTGAGFARIAAAAPAFPLHTSGQFIVDSNNARVHLNAFNWYGAESTDFVVEGLEAQPLATIVSTIKGLGFNAVRLPFSNQLVETNPVVGNYALAANTSMEGENALTILDQVVAALSNAGIMVILDNHMSNAGWCCSTTDNNELWYNSTYSQADWIADWQTMAQRYQGNPWVIGADLRNEPRSPATWGGSASTDWHAAAQLGGNAVLAVNPGLLIFVEGVSYAGDLSGVASLPVQLTVTNHLVYEAHDYGFWYSSGFTSYSNYVNTITPKWGYLVTGANPQPLWIGEFGTCDTANTCVSSTNATDLGYWFNAMTSFLADYGVDWSYWAINGTTESGNSGGFGTPETYGVLTPTWNSSALPLLTSRLQSMMGSSAGFNLIPSTGTVSILPGAQGNATVTIVPQGGFSGTVNLTCSVSGPTGGATPQCSLPASETIAGTAVVNATVSMTTTGNVARNATGGADKLLRGAGGFALAGVLLLMGDARRWQKSFLLVLVMLASSFAVSACGSGGAVGSGGESSSVTSAGTYTVSVTGSATGMSAVTTQVSITVQ